MVCTLKMQEQFSGSLTITELLGEEADRGFNHPRQTSP
jgi:hypothetical protein